MKKAVLIAIVIIGFIGVLSWTSLQNTTRNTHIHFTGQTGALINIIYYSEKPPDKAEQHACDNRFAEMPDFMFNDQLKRWRAKYRQ